MSPTADFKIIFVKVFLIELTLITLLRRLAAFFTVFLFAFLWTPFDQVSSIRLIRDGASIISLP